MSACSAARRLLALLVLVAIVLQTAEICIWFVGRVLLLFVSLGLGMFWTLWFAEHSLGTWSLHLLLRLAMLENLHGWLDAAAISLFALELCEGY